MKIQTDLIVNKDRYYEFQFQSSIIDLQNPTRPSIS